MLFHSAWHFGPPFGRLRSELRQLVLAWILLSQFPLPVVHAHTAGASHHGRLAAHLLVDHTDHSSDSSHHGLHWHLISPWDHREGDRPSEAESSPLGLWGSKGPAILQPFQASMPDPPDDTLLPREHPVPLACPARFPTNGLARQSGFLQSYAGVTLRALVGVALC